MQIKRTIVIVLDGVGAGEAPDAALYHDEGSNSLANTATAVGGLKMPHLGRLGLGNITPILGVPPNPQPGGAFGIMQPLSAGKDTTTGHWELMGIHLPIPFPTFPHGFPPQIIRRFKELTGLDMLGNIPASGTEIIKELGMQHMRSGTPIVYTSADSVFQIAANEQVIPIEKLYHLCEISRGMLQGEYGVGRVIARPFIGDSPETFKRTERRKDFSLPPPGDTILDKLVKAGKQVWSVGKIDDIFCKRGITRSNHTPNNLASIKATLEFLDEDFEGLLFTNLIEFDMTYGHRNDPLGYAGALEQFDSFVPQILARLKPGDVCFITADHGTDPVTPSTDHSRECVPLLAFGPPIQRSIDLGVRKTFADLAATLADIFSLAPPVIGSSMLPEMHRR